MRSYDKDRPYSSLDCKTPHEASLFYLLLIFAPLAHGAVEIWSVAVLHLLASSVVALWIISMIRKGHIKIRRTPLDAFIMCFILLAGFSFLISVYPYASRMQLYFIISYAALFYYLTGTLKSRHEIFRLVWVLVIFGSLFAIAGLIFVSGSLPGLKIFSSGNYRISFTFVNANHFAGYLEMIAMLGLGLAFAYHGAKRFLLFALCIFIAVAVFFSLSRGGTIGLLSGLVFFSAVFVSLRVSNYWIPAALAFLLIFSMVWIGQDPVMDRLVTLKDPFLAGKDRLKIWAGVLNMISDNFWFGTGIGTFKYVFPRYLSEVSRSFINHAHNDYLELMAEMGVGGILAVLSGTMVLFITGLRDIFTFRHSRLQAVGIGALSGCFALLVHGMTDFNFHIPSNAILFIVCLAVTVNSVIVTKELYSKKQLMLIDVKVPEQWRLPTYLFIIVCFLVSSILVVSPYIGESYLKEARRLQMSKDYESAFIAIKKALLLDPGNAENMAAMGDLLVSRSNDSGSNSEKEMYMSSSLKYYDDAISVCPVNSYYYSNKGFVLNQLGRNDEAEEAFIKAVNFAPMNSVARYSLGYFYLKQGSLAKAYETYSVLLLLDRGFLPKVLNSIWIVSPSYESLKPAVPENSAHRNEFAEYLFNKNEQEAALNELRLAFSLEPSAKNALTYLNGLSRVEEWDLAVKTGERYLLQFNHEVSLLKHMALLYEKLGNNDKAISIYQHLIADNPEEVSIYLSFADCYRKREQYSEAISVLVGAIQHMPADESLYYALDDLYRRDHKNKEAINLLKSLLEFKPGDADIYFKIALNYKDLKMTEKALEYLRLAIFQRPQKAYYRYIIGMWYRELGLSQLSADQFNKCLDINSGHEDCKRSVNEIYNEVGITK
ncbi:MAG: O-antigen ligase family protein [Nitrospirae bacterium]|nr:O-antigen ligase family protein [Nitrospirota bacterium]